MRTNTKGSLFVGAALKMADEEDRVDMAEEEEEVQFHRAQHNYVLSCEVSKLSGGDGRPPGGAEREVC